MAKAPTRRSLKRSRWPRPRRCDFVRSLVPVLLFIPPSASIHSCALPEKGSEDPDCLVDEGMAPGGGGRQQQPRKARAVPGSFAPLLHLGRLPDPLHPLPHSVPRRRAACGTSRCISTSWPSWSASVARRARPPPRRRSPCAAAAAAAFGFRSPRRGALPGCGSYPRWGVRSGGSVSAASALGSAAHVLPVASFGAQPPPPSRSGHAQEHPAGDGHARAGFPGAQPRADDGGNQVPPPGGRPPLRPPRARGCPTVTARPFARSTHFRFRPFPASLLRLHTGAEIPVVPARRSEPEPQPAQGVRQARRGQPRRRRGRADGAAWRVSWCGGRVRPRLRRASGACGGGRICPDADADADP